MTEQECLDRRTRIKTRYQKLKLECQALINKVSVLYAEILRLKNKYCNESSPDYDLVCCYTYTSILPILPNYQQILQDLITRTDTDIFSINCLNLDDMGNRFAKVLDDFLDFLKLEEDLQKMINDLQNALNTATNSCPEQISVPHNIPD